MKNCIHCGSNDINKFGIVRNEQMYYCKDCNKHFTKNSNPKRGLIINGQKHCSNCKIFKPISEFFLSDGKPRSRCKECYLKNNNSRYRNYNIDKNIFNEMLYSQGNKCSICNKTFKSNKQTFIDHNHITNKIRGLLCPKCNILLGNCGDNIEILKSAIMYLIKHQ